MSLNHRRPTLQDCWSGEDNRCTILAAVDPHCDHQRVLHGGAALLLRVDLHSSDDHQRVLHDAAVASGTCIHGRSVGSSSAIITHGCFIHPSSARGGLLLSRLVLRFARIRWWWILFGDHQRVLHCHDAAVALVLRGAVVAPRGDHQRVGLKIAVAILPRWHTLDFVEPTNAAVALVLRARWWISLTDSTIFGGIPLDHRRGGGSIISNPLFIVSSIGAGASRRHQRALHGAAVVVGHQRRGGTSSRRSSAAHGGQLYALFFFGTHTLVLYLSLDLLRPLLHRCAFLVCDQHTLCFGSHQRRFTAVVTRRAYALRGVGTWILIVISGRFAARSHAAQQFLHTSCVCCNEDI